MSAPILITVANLRCKMRNRGGGDWRATHEDNADLTNESDQFALPSDRPHARGAAPTAGSRWRPDDRRAATSNPPGQFLTGPHQGQNHALKSKQGPVRHR